MWRSHSPRKIEPPFLAVRLRKMQSDQDHHLAAFPLKYSNFICHEVSNIPHQTYVASTSLENIDWLPASKKCELSIQRQKNAYCLSLFTYTMILFTFWKSKCIKTVSWELWLMRVKGGYQKSSLQTFTKWVMHVHSFGRYIMIARCMKNVYLLNSSL